MRTHVVRDRRHLGLAMPPGGSQKECDHLPEWEFSEEEIWDMRSLTVQTNYTAVKSYTQSSRKHNILLPRSGSSLSLTAPKYAATSAPMDVPVAEGTAVGLAIEAAGAKDGWAAARSLNVEVGKKLAVARYSDDDDDDDEKPGMIPPHLITSRQQRAMASSVMEGAGRTLKGRDLRNVRNAVWKHTGFDG